MWLKEVSWDRKIRIDGVDKINPYSNDEDTVFKDTVKHLIVSDVKNTLKKLDEDLDYLDVVDFVNNVKYYDVQV